MTLASIWAILSILAAFGVDAQTITNVQNILIPPAATTTQAAYVPVIQSPVIENEPVYFGSTPVVQAPAPVVSPQVEAPAPVVVLNQMGLTIKNVTKEEMPKGTDPNFIFLRVFVQDANGAYVLKPDSVVEYLVDGVKIRTSLLNSYLPLNNEPRGETPGSQVAFTLPVGAKTLTVKAEGMEKTLNVSEL